MPSPSSASRFNPPLIGPDPAAQLDLVLRLRLRLVSIPSSSGLTLRPGGGAAPDWLRRTVSIPSSSGLTLRRDDHRGIVAVMPGFNPLIIGADPATGSG